MSRRSRRVDGKPETAADKRFFNLRAAGKPRPGDPLAEILNRMHNGK